MDDRQVEPPKSRKSVGAECNWGIRFQREADAVAFMDNLAGELSTRMKGVCPRHAHRGGGRGGGGREAACQVLASARTQHMQQDCCSLCVVVQSRSETGYAMTGMH